MQPIRGRITCREDLLVLLKTHPLSRAFKRALVEPGGKVEVLGGFIPDRGFPYWAVRVRSKHGRDWYVRVVADEHYHCLHIRRQEPDWDDWAGSKYGTHPWPTLMNGDRPLRNRMFWRQARARIRIRRRRTLDLIYPPGERVRNYQDEWNAASPPLTADDIPF